MLFQFLDWDAFEPKCLTILKQSNREDLNQMNFLLEDYIPGTKLQKVERPYELFSLMVNAELLSPDNLYFLAAMLSSAHRRDLTHDLLRGEHVEGKLTVLKRLFVREELPYVYRVHKMQFVWT